MCYLSSADDDTPDAVTEAERCLDRHVAVRMLLEDLHLVLDAQADLGHLIATGRTDQDLDARIVEVERAVFEATERFNVALCTQTRGGPYRLLDASRGGVARSMRFRLAQNRTVASIEAHAARMPDERALISAEA